MWEFYGPATKKIFVEYMKEKGIVIPEDPYVCTHRLSSPWTYDHTITHDPTRICLSIRSTFEDRDDWGCVIDTDVETDDHVIEYSELWLKIRTSEDAMREMYDTNYGMIDAMWDFDKDIDVWYVGQCSYIVTYR